VPGSGSTATGGATTSDVTIGGSTGRRRWALHRAANGTCPLAVGPCCAAPVG